MPQKISDLHPSLAARLAQYDRVRDFLEGADKLRDHDLAAKGDAATAYLPRLSPKQDEKEYAAYVRRALYYNAPGRTRDGFLGLIFGREPEMDLGAAEPLAEDADLQGTPLPEMLEEAVEEVLAVARFGWLVDRPEAPAGASKLDAERDGIRPYLVPYQSENIINWSLTRIGTRWKLGRVVLKETYEAEVDGTTKTLIRYRELLLEAEGYVVRLWTQEKGQGEYRIESTAYPLLGGKRITEIPFYFFDPRGGRPAPGKSPLVDIVEIARSHYQSSADLEHARFSCSLPTPYFIGFSEEEASGLSLGGLNGIVASDPAAKVGFLEYSGAGVTPLENALTQKAEMMAKLGSRMLAEDKKDAEAAETLRIRASGESATLADIARAVGRIASQALTFAARWMGSDTPVEITLNTEYTAATMSPQEIAELLKAVQAGELPGADFRARLRKVGIIEADRTDEEIEAELEAERAKREETAGAALEATAKDLAEKAKGAAE
ncbi:MAG: DUF4055 domain-containing protein [Spirochaetaceae bacterium]|nr:DUF4055 domain-containing protein [Spirochaetaceae bacterium]